MEDFRTRIRKRKMSGKSSSSQTIIAIQILVFVFLALQYFPVVKAFGVVSPFSSTSSSSSCPTRIKRSQACDTWQRQHQQITRATTTKGQTRLYEQPPPTRRRSSSNSLEDQIEENSRRRAQVEPGGGLGQTAAGALLGGLLLGPFGALFGASLGSNFGAKRALEKARQQEMERLGITQDMLDAARDVGLTLERSVEGRRAIQTSLETQQRLAKRLDVEATSLYQKAVQVLKEDPDAAKEAMARKLLLDRQRILDQLKQVLKNCAEERKRLETMEANVAALERRAMEVEALLRRTVGAKTSINAASTTSSSSFSDLTSLSPEDPLLQKFRDMGID